jgi:hypothetical protein
MQDRADAWNRHRRSAADSCRWRSGVTVLSFACRLPFQKPDDNPCCLSLSGTMRASLSAQ